MMLSELLMIIVLIWFGLMLAAMYWARHTTMFDDDEVDEQPNNLPAKNIESVAEIVDLQVSMDKVLERLDELEVTFNANCNSIKWLLISCTLIICIIATAAVVL